MMIIMFGLLIQVEREGEREREERHFQEGNFRNGVD